MQLTTSQKQTIKAWVQANNSSLFDQSSVDLLNAVASPSYLAWRTLVTRQEILQNGFDWTRLDNLSVGKARIWQDIFAGLSPEGLLCFNPSKANVRAGIEAVWVGTAADLAVRAAVYGHCQRAVTVCEKLFVAATAGGSGTRGSSANPDTFGTGDDGNPLEGMITLEQVIASEAA
jgi:hypothetical protein